MTQGMLEEQAENACRDRSDDEQPAELRVPVVGCNPPVSEAAPHAAKDAHPVAPEEDKEHDRGREVRRDEEGDEVLVVLVDVPAEQAREDDAVAKARDRKQLGDALEQSQDDRLEVADRCCCGDHAADCRAFRSPPDWNHAKTRSATPSRKAAIPCLTWW